MCLILLNTTLSAKGKNLNKTWFCTQAVRWLVGRIDLEHNSIMEWYEKNYWISFNVQRQSDPRVPQVCEGGFKNEVKSEGSFEGWIRHLQRNPKEEGYFEWKKFP